MCGGNEALQTTYKLLKRDVINVEVLESIFPREYILSEHPLQDSCVGKEWGWYFINDGVNKYNIENGNKIAISTIRILIFDITLRKYNTSNQVAFRIEPLIQETIIIHKNTVTNEYSAYRYSNNDSDNDEKIYIMNPRIGYHVENIFELNYSDSNYQIENDNGAIIFQNRLNYSSVSYELYDERIQRQLSEIINHYGSNAATKAISLLKMPYGTILDETKFWGEFYYRHSDNIRRDVIENNNENNIIQFPTRGEQISYGDDHFIDEMFSFVCDSICLGTDCYFEDIITFDSISPKRISFYCDFEFAIGNSALSNWSMLNDDTNFMEYLSNNYTFDELRYERISTSIDINTDIVTDYNVGFYSLGEATQIFRFTPSFSGYYEIEINRDDVSMVIYSDEFCSQLIECYEGIGYYLDENNTYYITMYVENLGNGKFDFSPAVLPYDFEMGLAPNEELIYSLIQEETSFVGLNYPNLTITVFDEYDNKIYYRGQSYYENQFVFLAHKNIKYHIVLQNNQGDFVSCSIDKTIIGEKYIELGSYYSLENNEDKCIKFMSPLTGNYLINYESSDPLTKGINISVFSEDNIMIDYSVYSNNDFKLKLEQNKVYYIIISNEGPKQNFKIELSYVPELRIYAKTNNSPEFVISDNSNLMWGTKYYIRFEINGEDVTKHIKFSFIKNRHIKLYNDEQNKYFCFLIDENYYEEEINAYLMLFTNIRLQESEYTFDDVSICVVPPVTIDDVKSSFVFTGIIENNNIKIKANNDYLAGLNHKNAIFYVNYYYNTLNSTYGTKEEHKVKNATTIDSVEASKHLEYLYLELVIDSVYFGYEHMGYYYKLIVYDKLNISYYLNPYFESGNGFDKPFVIADCLQFMNIKETINGNNTIRYNFILNDFNFYGVNYIDPINADFAGILDGCNHEYWACLRTGNFYNGDYALFKSISGTVKNIKLHLTMYGSPQNANSKFGVLCVTNKGTIENCLISGSIGSSNFITQANVYGGIVAVNYGTVKNCSSNSWFYCGTHAGGIVGDNYGIVNGCKFSGSIYYIKITSNYDCIGGIVGVSYASSTIKLCTFTGYIEVMDYTENKGHNGEFHFSMEPYIGRIYGKKEEEVDEYGNVGSGNMDVSKLQSNINWWNWGNHHHDQTVNVH